MQQSQQKRQQFHHQIRKKQHETIFKKIRARISHQQNSNSTTIAQLRHLLARLPQMYALAATVEGVLDNQDAIVQYVKDIRKYQDNEEIFMEPGNGGQGNMGKLARQQEGRTLYIDKYMVKDTQQQRILIPLLEYLLHVTGIIHQHISMDAEYQQNNEQEYWNRENMYSQILLPINYMLINLTSQELPLCYLEVVAKFVRHRIFVDCLHNVFLNENLTMEVKQQFLTHFLKHLQNNPIFTLNNCYIFTRILYYCLYQSPTMFDPKFATYHTRIMKLIDRICSTLTFGTTLSIKNKNQFKEYSLKIAEKVCIKSEGLCVEICDLGYFMKSIEEAVAELRRLFTTRGKIDEDYGFESVVQAMNVLANLGYFNNITACINQYHPTIWINLMTIYQKIPIQAWLNESQGKKVQLPAIFEHQKFTNIVFITLKCISNFICTQSLCESFLNGNRGKMSWIEILTQIYNNYYKSSSIRVECLYILSNVIIISAREQPNLRLPTNQQNIHPAITILNACTDLLHQILKLHNSNKNIIISVIKTILFIIGLEEGNIKKCIIFRDHCFINRLAAIANVNPLEEATKTDFYSEDVKLQAHYLWEAFMISNGDQI